MEVVQPVMGVIKVRAALDAEKNLHQPIKVINMLVSSPKISGVGDKVMSLTLGRRKFDRASIYKED